MQNLAALPQSLSVNDLQQNLVQKITADIQTQANPTISDEETQTYVILEDEVYNESSSIAIEPEILQVKQPAENLIIENPQT